MCLEGVLILKWVVIQDFNVKAFLDQRIKECEQVTYVDLWGYSVISRTGFIMCEEPCKMKVKSSCLSSIKCCAWCLNPRAGREKASKTMQLAKREVYYWLESGLLPQPTQWCRVREPWAQAVTQIYRVSTHHWFKWIGYKFAKQFHWSKLSRRWDFPGGFRPVPNFLLGKQWSAISES